MEQQLKLNELPLHHVRYARAWTLYRDKDLPEETKIILENEMDNAQNSFTFKEFQEFKVTLPGFVEYWEKWKNELLSV